LASRDAVGILSRLIPAKEGYVDRDRDTPVEVPAATAATPV
jgi:hypothetical protein